MEEWSSPLWLETRVTEEIFEKSQVFDVPRMTKMAHREESVVPEFRANAEPLLKFSPDTEKLFNPEIMTGKVAEGDVGVSAQENLTEEKLPAPEEPIVSFVSG